MQTHVYVGITRPTQASELRSAIAERANCRRGEVSIVGEPLNATCSLDRHVWGNLRDGIAVGPRTAREGAGLIRRSVNRHRPAGADGEDWANRPTSDHRIHDLVGVPCQGLAAAKGKLINGISGKDVGGIVVAWRPFRPGIVDILPVCRRAESIFPSSI